MKIMELQKNVLKKRLSAVFGLLVIGIFAGCDAVPPITENLIGFKYKEEFSESLEIHDLASINQAIFSVEVGSLDIAYHDEDFADIRVNYLAETSKETDTGNINSSDIYFLGNSSFSTDIGNIRLGLSSQEPGAAEVEVQTDTGNIDVDVNGLSYEKKSTNEDDDFSGSETIVVSEKCKINSATDIGKISIK